MLSNDWFMKQNLWDEIEFNGMAQGGRAAVKLRHVKLKIFGFLEEEKCYIVDIFKKKKKEKKRIKVQLSKF